MNTKTDKFIYWAPRILSIVLILFLTIFSWDVFDENLGFWPTVLGLFIHNIPALLLAAIIWISWKYEVVGGLAFMLAGLAHMVFSIIRGAPDPWYITLTISLILDGPALLISILFLVGWSKKRSTLLNKLNESRDEIAAGKGRVLQSLKKLR